MIVGCVGCGTKFVVPDEKVPESGIKVRCSKCQHTFYIKKEKAKKKGPSSVVLVDPELIAEVQRSRAESTARAESGAQEDASSSARGPGREAHVSTQIMSRESVRADAEAAGFDFDMAAETIAVRKAEGASPQRRASARVSTPIEEPDEPVFELEEVYLPPDWTKRIAVGLLILLGLALALGVAIIIRNDFAIPEAKNAFSVLLYGPVKKRGQPPKPLERSRSYEVTRTGFDHVTTGEGVFVVAVQGEVKNISHETHGRYYVRASLEGPSGETLVSERPCGTRLDIPRLTGLKSEVELDGLYTESGEGGRNEAVGAFQTVPCSVVFFAAPRWAENPRKTELEVTRVDGERIGP